MDFQVKMFARARDLADADSVTVALSGSCTIADLRRALSEQYPALQPVMTNLLIAVDNQYATDEMPIAPQAEIACFPPVSGG
ncbi:MAG: MoaD/ThiS family protein [Planctomycetota bacterium]|nr:MoaD/ThiS family protein [Planctomycetota bacterium]MDA1214121.1 MoaD/ThiS family protein [Planctomycetota bacterium]